MATKSKTGKKAESNGTTTTAKKTAVALKMPKDAPQIDGLELSNRTYFRLDCRRVTGSFQGNHRDIFRKDVYEAGYDLFHSLPGHPELPPLWELATSEDKAKQAEFLRIMELYEGTNPADTTIIDLAQSMYAGRVGQIYAIQLTYKPSKKGEPKVEIVSGHRRVVAALWLFCKGLWPKPLVECYFVNGNDLALAALQKDENACRKAVNPIVVAQGYQRALNAGATIEQVAQANGVSEPTVERWLKFLELEPKEQDKLVQGKLRHEDAIQIVDDRRQGGEGRTEDGLDADTAATVRPAKGGKRNRKAGKWSTKKIEQEYANPTAWKKGISAETVRLVLGAILGHNDKEGTAIAATSGGEEEGDEESNGQPADGFVAVMPPEGVNFGLLEDEGGELEVDEEGNVVVAGK